MDSNEELIRTLMKLIPFQQGKDKMTKSKMRRKKTRIVKSLRKQISGLMKNNTLESIGFILWNEIYQKFHIESVKDSDYDCEAAESVEAVTNDDGDLDFEKIPLVEKNLCDQIAAVLVKEFQQITLDKCVSLRTSKICSRSLCNGTVGYLNDQIIAIDIAILSEISLNSSTNILWQGNDILYKSGIFSDKNILIKQLSSESVRSKNSEMILGMELKILSYVGSHCSIIKFLGLTYVSGVASSVFETRNFTLLQNYSNALRLTKKQILLIIRDVISATQFLHVRKVLHNNITIESILMIIGENENDRAILADFTCACHIRDVNFLSKMFQTMFTKYRHLPHKVLKGDVKPSFRSDIYSIGCLTTTLSERLSQFTTDSEHMEMFNISKLLKLNKRHSFPKEITRQYFGE